MEILPMSVTQNDAGESTGPRSAQSVVTVQSAAVLGYAIGLVINPVEEVECPINAIPLSRASQVVAERTYRGRKGNQAVELVPMHEQETMTALANLQFVADPGKLGQARIMVPGNHAVPTAQKTVRDPSMHIADDAHLPEKGKRDPAMVSIQDIPQEHHRICDRLQVVQKRVEAGSFMSESVCAVSPAKVEIRDYAYLHSQPQKTPSYSVESGKKGNPFLAIDLFRVHC